MFNSGNATPFTMPVTPAYGGSMNCGNNWGDDWIALAIIAMIFGGGGFGFGGWGGGAGLGMMEMFLPFMMMGGWGNGFGFGNNGTPASVGDVQRGFDNQSVMNKLNGIEQGICSLGYDNLAQINGVNVNMLQGFNGVQRDICQGLNGVNSNIQQLGFQNQNCCCETNRNIDSVRYENARNTCDIVNAIREDGALTRAQMTATEMQNLRDQLNTANLQLSQQAQSANLINQLRPCPIPAYLSCSPYTSYDPFRAGYGYGNNGCGCNSGCC